MIDNNNLTILSNRYPSLLWPPHQLYIKAVRVENQSPLTNSYMRNWTCPPKFESIEHWLPTCPHMLDIIGHDLQRLTQALEQSPTAVHLRH